MIFGLIIHVRVVFIATRFNSIIVPMDVNGNLYYVLNFLKIEGERVAKIEVDFNFSIGITY